MSNNEFSNSILAIFEDYTKRVIAEDQNGNPEKEKMGNVAAKQREIIK